MKGMKNEVVGLSSRFMPDMPYRITCSEPRLLEMDQQSTAIRSTKVNHHLDTCKE